ncbi:MAG: segregation and condensation protein A [Actinomycetes bacterium]
MSTDIARLDLARAQAQDVPGPAHDRPSLGQGLGFGGGSDAGFDGASDAGSDGKPDSDVDASSGGFHVHLSVFEGPFDLLLALISKHKLDVTEVALHQVTDEFIAHIRAGGPDWDLDQASQFLVVAATLLDLKAARLLPAADVEDEDDLELLEARDLLFARLLQYRAYKQIAAQFSDRMAAESRRHARAVGMEPRFAALLPEVLLGLGPSEFAILAARALAPKPEPTVGIEHVYAPLVSVREQAVLLVDRLRRLRGSTFRGLIADCDSTIYVVARFLALLDLYREGAVSFDQVSPLGELYVRWTGPDEGTVDLDGAVDSASVDSGSVDADAAAAPAGPAGDSAAGADPTGSDDPADPADDAPPERTTE